MVCDIDCQCDCHLTVGGTGKICKDCRDVNCVKDEGGENE